MKSYRLRFTLLSSKEGEHNRPKSRSAFDTPSGETTLTKDLSKFKATIGTSSKCWLDFRISVEKLKGDFSLFIGD